ncbi:MFS transporter [Wenzhouxiangella sp. AB-CW3]|uniref:MFS transporter n=1 Tax=Wenzhouxiangella sp. AB-CW3 TaxID=2771012 RepID=UPI00168A8DE4|nr:MFS transporter [Wenzhouxiangella sp. AB-CW3]QOC23527.1 MFS transporter [Wenzhouxiangella sp. AB-CW3]
MNHSPVQGLPPAGRFALAAALCSSVGQTFFIGLFGSGFRAEFGLSETALGSFYGLATLASGLLMFWLGAIADYLPMRRAIVLTACLLTIGAFMIGLSPGLAWLVAGLFLVRLAGQGLIGHLAVVAAGRYARKRRGRAVAMATYGFILGEASFPPLVAFALGWMDWRSVWLCAGAGILLVALPALWWMARPLAGSGGDDAHQASGTPPEWMTRRKLFVHGSFLRVLAVVLVPPFVVTALFLHQSALADRLEWSLTAVASGFVLFALMQGSAAFAGGRLVDRFSARALLRFHLLPAGLGVLGLGVIPAGPAMWLMFAGLGMTAGLNGVISGAVWVELFGTRQLGMIRGVYAALMVLSTAAGPVVLGLLLDWQVSLLTMGLVLLAWVVIVPLLLVPGVRGFRYA